MEWLILVVYLLALGVLTAVGAPIAAALFRPLPRRGAAFALPAALVPFTIVVFWVGQLTFGLHTLGFGLGAVIGWAALATRAGGSPDWRSVAAMYGVFVVGFLVMIAFRAAHPGITPAAGEQFLHFGLVNAIERANSLPPENMWFAGRELRYYYGTQLQVASLSMLTGTPLRYGFNLGIATFYGLLFVVAYGLAGAIVHRQGDSYRLGGAVGAFFVALAGPTTPAIRLATPYLPEAVAASVEPAAFGFVADRFNGGDLGRTVAELSAAGDWSWWYTRYVVPGTIQEVPLYSFVKGDLHGHALANGYVLFAGALALAYYATPAAARTRRRAIVFGGLGAVAGLFGVINTWSLPTAVGLAVLAVAASDAHPATLLPPSWADRLRPAGTARADEPGRVLRRELWRLGLAAVAGLVVLLIGIAIASPFLVFGRIPTNDGIGFLPPRSPLGPFLVIYAGLVSLFALYVLVRGWPSLAGTDRRRLAAGALTLPAATAATILVLDFAVLAMLGPLILTGWLLVRTDRAGFAVVLFVAGAGLLLSFELVHARIPQIANPRWNTSLKVAVQGWTLGAAGAGAAVALLLSRGVTRFRDRVAARPGTMADGPATAGPAASPPHGPKTDGGRPDTDTGSATGSGGVATVAWLVVVLLVVVAMLASAVFPVLMVSTEIGAELAADNYNPSLDGLKAAERFHAHEYDALRWLMDRPGHPTIVEAPGDSYDWTSPAATYSGLPSVVGWAHQKQYRSPAAYQRRVTHVDTIYTGEWSDAAGHLDRYEVTYVYVGPNERERYGSKRRSFDRDAFSVAFEGGAATIYEVDHAELPDPAG
jgi:YYY domain-containing protein